MLTIEPVPCLRDNYAYLLRDAAGDVWLVDPSEPGPPAQAIAAAGGRLRGILATHHHHDHVGGIDELVGDQDVWVAGHASDRGRIPKQSVFVDASTDAWQDTGLVLAGRRLLGLHIPGHTRGAIAWRLVGAEGEPDDVFTGDTLFAAGCGRLFEGTPAQMHASLQQLTALTASTRLWFGHEYTAANLRFAAAVEPDNSAIAERAAALPSCTTPTTVADERATNPFVRASTVEELAARRRAKDEFRG
ncbi:hydroxyacylglutathione hydrolase [Nannocystis punicea]|uniref:Hydroxyacylglutathione hydrolase n=1 Tax=Nannocystis punicea TaxID=2995304 RepID=A0ABY7H465_9BACT|nr:hydroxyacylglutathione hydrolase [Nannocystis poenicansa]WAS93982.1 hydroxyacylglutathione hydrolase [Nannocystis poenicansa]